jgi:hypothetical protein
VAPEGIYLSYVRSQGTHNTLLKKSLNRLDIPSSGVVYQRGRNWFNNWADFPSVVYVGQRNNSSIYFSHFLEYSGEGTYDYDIKYSLSSGIVPDLPPSKLHQDTIAAEHGFLSSAPLPGGGLQVSWLDGRYTKAPKPPKEELVGAAAGAGKGHGHGHGGGAMTLRTTTVGSREANALSDSTSVELDHRVCDCCNTATVATDSLIMVAYRDRSEHEIRDISYVVKPTGSGKWSTPKLVHADNWEITGCPVNGPALAANDAGNIAIIWYTAPADRAQINFARYDPDLDRFTAPIILDAQTPLGRVDLQLAPDGTAYATGLTTKEGADEAFLTLWTIAPDGTVVREDLTTTSPARSSGFPKIALFQDKLYWARTVVGAEKGEQFVEVCWR